MFKLWLTNTQKKANVPEEFLLVPRDEIGPTSEAVANNYNVK